MRKPGARAYLYYTAPLFGLMGRVRYMCRLGIGLVDVGWMEKKSRIDAGSMDLAFARFSFTRGPGFGPCD